VGTYFHTKYIIELIIIVVAFTSFYGSMKKLFDDIVLANYPGELNTKILSENSKSVQSNKSGTKIFCYLSLSVFLIAILPHIIELLVTNIALLTSNNLNPILNIWFQKYLFITEIFLLLILFVISFNVIFYLRKRSDEKKMDHNSILLFLILFLITFSFLGLNIFRFYASDCSEVILQTNSFFIPILSRLLSYSDAELHKTTIKYVFSLFYLIHMCSFMFFVICFPKSELIRHTLIAVVNKRSNT